MKIAIYSGEIPSSSFIENLITGMAERHYQVILYGRVRKKVRYGDNVSIHAFPTKKIDVFISFFFNILYFLILDYATVNILWKHINEYEILSPFQRANKLCRYFIVLRNKPDIFHIQWVKNGHEWLVLKEFGVKVLTSFRGAHINYTPIGNERIAQLYKDTLKLYDGYHAVSTAIQLEAQKYDIDSSKVYRIPGAVDSALLKNNYGERKIGNAPIKLLSVGRNHWKKGYHYALDACKVLKDCNIDFVYTIVGGVNSEEIIYQIHDLGLENHIKLINKVPYEQIYCYFQEADLFLLPSVEEGIANVVLEAMAIGVPVISTNCGGMAEVIKDSINGFIVPVRKSKVMASIILKILDGEFDLNTICLNARKTIEDYHLIPNQLDSFEMFYKSQFQSKC